MFGRLRERWRHLYSTLEADRTRSKLAAMGIILIPQVYSNIAILFVFLSKLICGSNLNGKNTVIDCSKKFFPANVAH